MLTYGNGILLQADTLNSSCKEIVVQWSYKISLVNSQKFKKDSYLLYR